MLAFTAHMTLLGDKGLTQLATLNHEAACDLADALAAVKGVKVLTPRYFNEIAFETPKPADEVLAALEKQDVIGGVRASRLFPGAGMDNVIIAAATECCTLTTSRLMPLLWRRCSNDHELHRPPHLDQRRRSGDTTMQPSPARRACCRPRA